MFTRKELERLKEEKAKELRGYWIENRFKSPKWTLMQIPVKGEELPIYKLVVASPIRIVPEGDDGNPHVTMLAYDGELWHLACGNAYLTGVMESDEATLKAAEMANTQEQQKDLDETYGFFAEEGYCSHWRKWYSEGDVCKHSKDLLTRIDSSTLDVMENYFYSQDEGSVDEEQRIAARMQLYSFKRHLLFIGEKGSGKTYDIYAYMKRHNLQHIFVGGNADVEAMDLKGNLLPFEKDGEKNFIWIDGPLTQAFRRAASGERIVLFIDELLRMSRSAQSLLVPSLTPDNDGNYVLDTGRVIDVVDGVGKTECIKAPVSNLWVLGTTNMGAEYGTPDMESALEDRFELIEKNNDLEKITRVLDEIAAEKGFEKSVTAKMVAFYESMTALKQEGLLGKLINLRHLAQALEDAISIKDIHDRLMDRAPKWVERDMGGRLLDEQITTVKKCLSKAGL